MKRIYDSYKEFKIILPDNEFSMIFSNDWNYTDMLNYMLDTFSIDSDSIIEIHSSLIRRYKLQSN